MSANADPGHTVAGLARELGLDVAGLAPTPVTGIHLDNRAIGAGDVFAALPGAKTHGARFAAAAVTAGAVAILTDADGAALIEGEGLLEGDGPQVPVLVTADPRAALGEAASWIHGRPGSRLNGYAVTGTNGKTTTTYFLEYVLAALGRTTGLIGTVELKIGPDRTPARLTTPEATTLHGWFAQMVAAGVDDVVMEVSSHALSLHRIDGVRFAVAGFTNLTPDHLDFHDDMAAYFAAKAALFTPERTERAVITVDDEWGRRLAADVLIDTVTLSTTGGEADWQVRTTSEGPAGTGFVLSGPDGAELSTSVALPGGFNVANAALALVMVIESGVGVADLAAALRHGVAATVPGRMELVASEPRVLVDFAHNTEALQLALDVVRGGAPGRVFVVFGSAGDRDRVKRPLMGEVAVRGADVVVITDDDPHDEDPAAIRAEIMTGALAALAAEQRAGREVDVYEIAPRQAAIRRVVRFAAQTDTVLVAGRGHETWQEIAGVDHHLDDRQEVRGAMTQRRHPGSSPEVRS